MLAFLHFNVLKCASRCPPEKKKKNNQCASRYYKGRAIRFCSIKFRHFDSVDNKLETPLAVQSHRQELEELDSAAGDGICLGVACKLCKFSSYKHVYYVSVYLLRV